MDMLLKETCENLRKFSKALKEKEECVSFLEQTEEEFIEDNLKISKPELHFLKNAIEPKKPNALMYIVITLLLAVFFELLVIIMIEDLKDYREFIPFFIISPLIPILIMGMCYLPMIYEYKRQLKKYEETIEENAKRREYNNIVYPALLKTYNEGVLECKEVFKTKSVEYKARMDIVEQKVKKYNGIIAPKFYAGIDEIVGIIEDGRADSLKEAINLFVSDSRQQELVREQQKMNEIAEQQRQNMQRHNMAMEEQARRQVDALKQQENARRQGAPSCVLCKNWPCGGDPAYCGSFVKKQ